MPTSFYTRFLKKSQCEIRLLWKTFVLSPRKYTTQSYQVNTPFCESFTPESFFIPETWNSEPMRQLSPFPYRPPSVLLLPGFMGFLLSRLSGITQDLSFSGWFVSFCGSLCQSLSSTWILRDVLCKVIHMFWVSIHLPVDPWVLSPGISLWGVPLQSTTDWVA